jgi:hypothetical protein
MNLEKHKDLEALQARFTPSYGRTVDKAWVQFQKKTNFSGECAMRDNIIRALETQHQQKMYTQVAPYQQRAQGFTNIIHKHVGLSCPNDTVANKAIMVSTGFDFTGDIERIQTLSPPSRVVHCGKNEAPQTSADIGFGILVEGIEQPFTLYLAAYAHQTTTRYNNDGTREITIGGAYSCVVSLRHWLIHNNDPGASFRTCCKRHQAMVEAYQANRCQIAQDLASWFIQTFKVPIFLHNIVQSAFIRELASK